MRSDSYEIWLFFRLRSIFYCDLMDYDAVQRYRPLECFFENYLETTVRRCYVVIQNTLCGSKYPFRNLTSFGCCLKDFQLLLLFVYSTYVAFLSSPLWQNWMLCWGKSKLPAVYFESQDWLYITNNHDYFLFDISFRAPIAGKKDGVQGRFMFFFKYLLSIFLMISEIFICVLSEPILLLQDK